MAVLLGKGPTQYQGIFRPEIHPATFFFANPICAGQKSAVSAKCRLLSKSTESWTDPRAAVSCERQRASDQTPACSLRGCRGAVSSSDPRFLVRLHCLSMHCSPSGHLAPHSPPSVLLFAPRPLVLCCGSRVCFHYSVVFANIQLVNFRSPNHIRFHLKSYGHKQQFFFAPPSMMAL